MEVEFEAEVLLIMVMQRSKTSTKAIYIYFKFEFQTSFVFNLVSKFLSIRSVCIPRTNHLANIFVGLNKTRVKYSNSFVNISLER